MTDYQFEERLKRLETMMRRMYAKVMGEEMPAPPKPFVEEPWQPIDWTARATMHPSTMRELAAAMPPLNGAAEAQALGAVAVGRQPIQKGDPSQRVVGQGRGWVEPRELPHHGSSYGDRVIDAIGGEGKK
jgi:hypothetical protein